VPKYVALYESRSLKQAVKFQQKYWCNRTASFALFTSRWCLCTMHKMIGEIDSRVFFAEKRFMAVIDVANFVRLVNCQSLPQ
jgi:hypothetical protein